jgi:hypothetical protein
VVERRRGAEGRGVEEEDGLFTKNAVSKVDAERS